MISDAHRGRSWFGANTGMLLRVSGYGLCSGGESSIPPPLNNDPPGQACASESCTALYLRDTLPVSQVSSFSSKFPLLLLDIMIAV